MFYIVYKIINNINEKYYIGCHKTKDKNDGYMGSGIAIKSAIKKYGLHNFSKEIIIECNNEKEMFDIEKRLIKLSKNSYNLKNGGLGGFDFINRTIKQKNNNFPNKNLSKLAIKKLIYLLDNDKEFRKKYIDDRVKGMKDNKGNFKGKKHTEETKRKISEKNKLLVGNKNSQYGTCWITDGKINSKLGKDSEIPFMWSKGRTMSGS